MICNSRISVCKYSISYMYQEYVVNIHFTVQWPIQKRHVFAGAFCPNKSRFLLHQRKRKKKNYERWEEREKEEGSRRNAISYKYIYINVKWHKLVLWDVYLMQFRSEDFNALLYIFHKIIYFVEREVRLVAAR